MSESPRPGGDAGDPAAQADSMVRRGLEHYGRGELMAAIGEWQSALELNPDHKRARRYHDYVVENFDVLAGRFREVREAARGELEVPFGVDSLDDDDDDGDDYAEVQVTRGDAPAPAALAPSPTPVEPSSLSPPPPSIDDGWDLDDEAASPPPARSRAATIAASPPPPAPAPPPASPPPPRLPSSPPSPADATGFEDDLGTRDTVELSARKVKATASASRPVGAQSGLRGDEETSPGQKLEALLRTDDEITTPGGATPPPYERGLSLSEEALRAIRPVPSFSDGAPPEETTADRGTMDRGFELPSLPDLDDLDIEVRRDDRRLEGDSDPDLVAFRTDDGGPRFEEERTNVRRDRDRPAAPAPEPETETDEEMTAERGGAREVGEDEQTVDRGSMAGAGPAVIVDRSLFDDLGTGPKQPAAPAVDELVDAVGPVAFATMCTSILRDLDVDAGAGESEGDRVRRRVSALIQRAEEERTARRLALAVAALDLALEEEPESATAQKLIARSRDAFCSIYEEYIGDLGQVPTMALPMHELASQDLDSRAVFLLSRVDGTFTFEEIVDVSGMSRLEALRHLAKLVLLGVLEVARG